MKKRSCGLLMAVLLTLPVAAIDAEAKGRPEKGRDVSLQHPGGRFLPEADPRVTLFPDAPHLQNRYSEASLVHMAYAALSEAILSSGHVVAFSLGDFRTYYRRDFDRLLVRELVTLDAPFRLEVRETEVADVDGSPVGGAFTPRWLERYTSEDAESLKEFMTHYRDFTVADGLKHPDASAEQRRMVAVTSYEVTATYDGESHTYRAVFKWIPGPPGEVTFEIDDYVTDGVGRALVSDLPVAPLEVLVGRSLATGKRERSAKEVEE